MRACSCDISKINNKKDEEARRISSILEDRRIEAEFDKLFTNVDKKIQKNLDENKENQKPNSNLRA